MQTDVAIRKKQKIEGRNETFFDRLHADRAVLDSFSHGDVKTHNKNIFYSERKKSGADVASPTEERTCRCARVPLLLLVFARAAAAGGIVK